MTIEPLAGSFVVHCDSCPGYLEVDTPVFSALVKQIKFKGWKIYKDKDGKWSHKCVACQEGG